MAPPLTTAVHAWGLVRSSDFWPHAAVTLTAFAIALAISISAGVLLGLVLGFRKFTGEVVEPVLISLYTVPKVAFYPVILLFLGIGMAAEITFGVIHGIIPVAIFTMNAVRTIKPVLIKTARVMKLTWGQMRF
jgi:NitT/TauT family transport system permease protein